MARHFNTAGPCRPDIHYMIPPARRLPDVRWLIDQEGYFAVHAPRQVGKTTALMALARDLTDEGRYASALVSMEAGAAFSTDTGAAESAILAGWRRATHFQLPESLQPPSWPPAEAGGRLGAALEAWARACPRPLVLFLDEIDALEDGILISVLRQLRDGHRNRPSAFPLAIALVGLRDVRDYKVGVNGRHRLQTASPFNIEVRSLTLRDFTADEVIELYTQHTTDTGQVFTPEATAFAFAQTQGQPWLVNMLASIATEELVNDRSTAITQEHLQHARSLMVTRQDTHFDSLAERLREPRVRAIVEPMLAGESMSAMPEDDVRFCLDLGLVRMSPTGGLTMANPIYAELVPKALAVVPRASLPMTQAVWRRPDGTLDEEKLLGAFEAFWRRHGQPLMGAAPYHEVAPHLVLLAFLDRVANGGGRVEREYAIGSRRMDISLEYGPADKRSTVGMEVKVWRDRRKDPLAEGLEQLDMYLAGLGLDHGCLFIFDRRSGLDDIEDRTSLHDATTPAGRRVKVLRG